MDYMWVLKYVFGPLISLSGPSDLSFEMFQSNPMIDF